MNIHKEHPPESGDLLAPPEWTMDMLQEGDQQIAVLKFKHTLVCRLSLAVPEADPEEARRKLADKARRWILDFRNRAKRA